MVELAFENKAKAVYLAGSTDLYAGSGNTQTSDVAAGDTLDTATVDELVAEARENDLEPFSDGLFRIIGHPRLFLPLLTEAGSNGAGFVNAAIRGTAGSVAAGVIGDYHGARFISAGSRGIKLAGQGAASIDVYKGILIGKQSLAMSDLGSIKTYVEPGGGPSDPLHQITATIGFRGFIGGALVEVANTSDGGGELDTAIRRSVLFEAAAA